MNKKTLSKLLLSSTIVFVSSFSLVSCFNTPIITKQHFDSKEFFRRNVNKEVEKISFDYVNKSKTFAISVKLNEVILPRLMNSNYNVEIKDLKIIPYIYDSISVSYVIKNKKSNDISDTFTYIISGFKVDLISTSILNNEVDKVMIDYPNKSNTLLNNASFENLNVTGFNTNRFEFKFLKNENSSDNTSTVISFKILDKNFKTNTSKIRQLVISKFKPPLLSTVELKKELDEITVDYKNKENISASEAKIQDVIFFNISTSKVSLVPVEIKLSNKPNSVLVSFRVNDINYHDNLSETKEFEINDFGSNILHRNQIKEELEKTLVDYPNKQTTLLSEINKDRFVATGYNKEKYLFLLIGFLLIQKSNDITIKYKLQSKEFPNITSEEKSAVISGFKAS